VLLLAALAVPGRTLLHGAHHLARGYPDLPGSLRALGAAITTPTFERS
jgi:UDP-N-acetylglucosamine enolpyruvyl transferase